MEKNRLKLFVVFWIACAGSVFAQTNRYMVFFSDKNNVTYNTENPLQYLSQKAIDRRNKINVAVTEQDLPVDKNYVQSLKDTGAEVYFTSKWFNSALVQMDDSLLPTVNGLPFVDSVNYIAKGAKLSFAESEVIIPEAFKDPDPVNADTKLQLKILGVDQMHEDGYLGEGMTIAVFDDGFVGVNSFKPFEHLFRDKRILGWKDYVKNSGNVFQYDDHGSASLSCIAADYGAVVGTAPGASYLLCVTEDFSSEYRIEEYNWLLAAEYADSAGADVISSSLGYSTFTDPGMNYTYEDLNGEKAIVTRAANLATDRGIIVVVSAGNEGGTSWKYVTAPADADDILAVGSINANGSKSAFSSVGYTVDRRIKPDVVALGSSTTVFFSDGVSGRISTGNGTSFAAPQISGFAAGIWQANPDWNGQEVINAIKYSGSNSLSPDSLIGFGIPSYRNFEGVDQKEMEIAVFPNPTRKSSFNVEITNYMDTFDLSIFDAAGKEVLFGLTETVIPNSNGKLVEVTMQDSGYGWYYVIMSFKDFKKTVKLIKI